MLTGIGLVICAYVFTRMLELGMSKNTSLLLRLVAVLTITLTILVTIDLLFRGMTNLTLPEAIGPLRPSGLVP